MPYSGMPRVHHGCLMTEDGSSIRLDSPAWFAWLAQATRFSYASPTTPYRFTVRKEKRRHSWYWYAYLKYDSKLHNVYLGASATLSAASLNAAGLTLARKVAPPPPTMRDA